MELEGKVGVITGAASGIGAACAQAFARAGCQVAVVDVNLEGATKVADLDGIMGDYPLDVFKENGAVIAKKAPLGTSDASFAHLLV